MRTDSKYTFFFSKRTTSIMKQISQSISNRLSDNSSNEIIFNKTSIYKVHKKLTLLSSFNFITYQNLPVGFMGILSPFRLIIRLKKSFKRAMPSCP